MTQLLYSAKDQRGRNKAGLIDAGSAGDALEKLRAAGLTDIELHDEPSAAAQRTDRLGLSGKEAARLAEFELRVRRNLGLTPVLAEVARRGWLWIAVVSAVTLWALLAQHPVVAGIGVLLLGLTFGLPAWGFRHARHYDGLLRAFSVGDWKRCEELIGALRGGTQPENLRYDLDVREAAIRATRGDTAQVLAALEKWRASSAASSPGLFETRVADVYHAAGDYPSFLREIRKAYEALPDDPSKQLDLALAEARLGDPSAADDLLQNLNAAGVPVHGRPFIHWTRGFIALRRGEPSAQSELGQAVAGFLEYEANPAMWTALGMCAGAYALALARDGRSEQAKEILERVSPILMVHGDKPLLEMIQAEVQPRTVAGFESNR
jgi:tetratricopeptide (TPR) repeat protein